MAQGKAGTWGGYYCPVWAMLWPGRLGQELREGRKGSGQARAPPGGADSKGRGTRLDQDTQTHLDPQHRTLGDRDTWTQKYTHADTDTRGADRHTIRDIGMGLHRDGGMLPEVQQTHLDIQPRRRGHKIRLKPQRHARTYTQLDAWVPTESHPQISRCPDAPSSQTHTDRPRRHPHSIQCGHRIGLGRPQTRKDGDTQRGAHMRTRTHGQIRTHSQRQAHPHLFSEQNPDNVPISSVPRSISSSIHPSTHSLIPPCTYPSLH